MEGGGWQGGNNQGMKAAGREAAGDPHSAGATPLLWSGGTSGALLGFYSLQHTKDIPPPESTF